MSEPKRKGATTKASARAKGHDWERVVADMLRPMFGPTVRRGVQSGDGSLEPDVVIPPELLPLWIECQCATWTDARMKLAQAKEASTRNGQRTWLPVAILKDSYQGKSRSAPPPMASMYLPDFLVLLRRALGTSEPSPLPRADRDSLRRMAAELVRLAGAQDDEQDRSDDCREGVGKDDGGTRESGEPSGGSSEP